MFDTDVAAVDESKVPVIVSVALADAARDGMFHAGSA